MCNEYYSDEDRGSEEIRQNCSVNNINDWHPNNNRKSNKHVNKHGIT